MGRHRSRSLTTLGVIGIAALVATGCGGGDDAAVVDTGTAPVPTPVDDGSGAAVGDGTAGQDLDGDGIPDAQPLGDLGATASIPDLSGGDVGGGLSSPSGTSPVFEASAVDGDDLVDTVKDGKTSDSATTIETPKDAAPTAPVFASAKIYVDGMTHDVEKGDAFPKDNPVFRLISITAGNIEIELIAGEFTSGGGSGVLIDKGELVSLVNASEQLTYRVKYMQPVKGDSGITF